MCKRKNLLGALCFLLIASIFGLMQSAPGTSAAATVTNPGFEANGATGSPSGWSSSGSTDADYTESGGHTGTYRLTHWRSTAYTVETWQLLTGLANAQYTLRVWTRSGGGQNAAYIALKNCGSPEQRVSLPVSSTWTQLSLSITVTNTQCQISLYSSANAGNWASFDDIEFFRSDTVPTVTRTRTPTSGGTLPTPTRTPTSVSGLSIRGVDVSTLKKNEDKGARYYYASGVQGDALQILKDHGVNYIRLKVWVNPADGYNNKARVVELGQRVKAKGLGLLIDFHYSDSWADPGQQTKPAAWASHTLTQLKSDVYNHTLDVCNALKAAGATPDMIQVGNEIRNGMLWPEGRITNSNFTNLSELLKQGYNAVKACSSSIQVVLHIDQGGNNATSRWWYDGVRAKGVLWDVTALSYYSYWHGTISAMQSNVADLRARYGKPVFLAETAYPFTLSNDDQTGNIIDTSGELTSGYPATPAGQQSNLRAVMTAVRNAGGLGIFYWEGAWTAVPGSGWDPYDPNSGNAWENQALFDFNDRPLPAMSEFR